MTTDVSARLGAAAAADSSALTAAANAAEDALACHRDALALLAEGWRGESGASAVDLLRTQCADAAGIVTALHRAAAGAKCLHEEWATPAGGCVEVGDDVRAESPHPASRADSAGSADSESDGGPVPLSSPAMPVPTASTAPPQVEPTAAWAPPAPPAWSSAGAGTALPDLGGTLVSLVAQVAQALGSYADVAGADVTSADVTSADVASADVAGGDVAGGNPPDGGTAARSPSMTADAASGRHDHAPSGGRPESAAPKLLAAERPSVPGEATPAPVVPPIPEPPQAVPTPPIEPLPAPVPPGPPASAAAAETPCEIAADELPKVGE